MRLLAPLLLIAVLAGGCGGGHKQTEAERVAMEKEFARLAMSIGSVTMGSGPADQTVMERYTNQYIDLTRKYKDALGDDGVKKRLTDEVSQVQPWCLTCATILDRERAKY